MIWLLVMVSFALGAELDVSAKGKSVLVYVDGEKVGQTPVSIEIQPGIHEITAKEDELSAAALNLKFAVFDQLNGRLQFDWKKQTADLVWPGEEKLKARDRALLRNRELALAKQPGMFALPAADPKKEIKSAEDLTFSKEVELVLDDAAEEDDVLNLDEEVLVEDEAEPFDFDALDLESDVPLADSENAADENVAASEVEDAIPALEPIDFDDEEPVDTASDELSLDFLDDELILVETDEEVEEVDELDLDSISFGEPDAEDVRFVDILDGVSSEEEAALAPVAPVVKPIREKMARVRTPRSGFPPWIVGAGAAVVAAGFYGQAGLQWSMAQGYAERARTLEGSSTGVAEYEFNVDYARKKSGLTRASIGIGSIVLVSGVGVTIALGRR